jgi:elongation factor G
MIGLPADYYPIELAIELFSADDLPRLIDLIDSKDVIFEKLAEVPGGLLSFRSEADLVTVLATLKAAFGDHLMAGYPSIAYRERITRAVEIKHAQQHPAGPAQPFTHIRMQIHPLEPGAGFVFDSALPAGTVAADLLAGAERGVALAKDHGLLAGYPVTDFRASLAGFDFGGAEPSPLALQAAARGAFQQIKTAAHPRLTEPSVELTIRLNGEPADAVRKAMVGRSETEIAGNDVPQTIALRFQARLAHTFALEAELARLAPGARVTSIRFAGMIDVPSAEHDADAG